MIIKTWIFDFFSFSITVAIKIYKNKSAEEACMPPSVQLTEKQKYIVNGRCPNWQAEHGSRYLGVDNQIQINNADCT